MSSENALWRAPTTAIVPAAAKTAGDLTKYAKQLSNRDVKQIVAAYESQSYEMMSSYVWSKAIAALKKQLGTLGMEFIGEMLGRSDITDTSPIATSITAQETISLSEDLGMINSTEAMRLRQCLETVSHFASLEGPDAEEVEMTHDEAMHCLRTCIQTILGHPRIEVAIEFASFRRELTAQTFKPDDANLLKLTASAYFFQRTTLSVLLAMLKTQHGAPLEHAIGNTNVILPLLWPKLRDPQRWQTGQTYAEVLNAGKKLAAIGLQKALLKVRGFDFVPETLRSDTFTEAAKAVLSAHESMNNYYNEPEPMRLLAALGTTIPMPAFAVVLTATLCVRLGNGYGDCWAAQGAANTILNGLSRNQWEYFINECLPIDRTLLAKLAHSSRPQGRWVDLVKEHDLKALALKTKLVRRLIEASVEGSHEAVARNAADALRSLGYSI